ncbi:FAD-dependent oxidoreductase [Yunchengibacter salinarum]|uniref:FAD-dependent oxidoreductase n=1 Tax=Yunchengibacter salinarum TaxID=3133399 RepID=UPI0035B650DD
MHRRHFLKTVGAFSALAGLPLTPLAAAPRADTVVVGAGVFGLWTAVKLRERGHRVTVVDAFGPANSAASSGGETRVTRCGYGDIDLYTRWACRARRDWAALSAKARLPLFHPMGVLWLHRADDSFAATTRETLSRHGIAHEQLGAKALARRYPVMRVAADEAALLEPEAGGLMARRAVQTLARLFIADGGHLVQARVAPLPQADRRGRRLAALVTTEGERLEADHMVMACGPWLHKVCPDALGGRLFVTRQEVFTFAASRTDTGDLPVWADLPFYGLPSVEGRGFKVANDTHGAPMDPDTADRRPGEEGERDARAFLARRFPMLKDRPLWESRVCQYANSANGDFILDQHPGLDNVWLAGGGSGHGFKHGPAVGRHMADLVNGDARPMDRFSLASKPERQQRQVQ